MNAPTDEPLRLRVGDDEPVSDVRAVVSRATRARQPSVALTHGAGGDLTSRGLTALAHGLAGRGHVTVRFDLPYREAGRRSPPAAERSVAGFSAAVRDLAGQITGGRWVVGGKSYGGRVASMAVANGLEAAGLLFYGYPLHAPGKADQPRVEHWSRIEVPCLFLQGTSDPFCDLDALREHLPRLPAGYHLEVIEGGDHSLVVPAARSTTGRRRPDSEVLSGLAGVVGAWLEGLT